MAAQQHARYPAHLSGWQCHGTTTWIARNPRPHKTQPKGGEREQTEFSIWLLAVFNNGQVEPSRGLNWLLTIRLHINDVVA